MEDLLLNIVANYDLLSAVGGFLFGALFTYFISSRKTINVARVWAIAQENNRNERRRANDEIRVLKGIIHGFVDSGAVPNVEVLFDCPFEDCSVTIAHKHGEHDDGSVNTQAIKKSYTYGRKSLVRK